MTAVKKTIKENMTGNKQAPVTPPATPAAVKPPAAGKPPVAVVVTPTPTTPAAVATPATWPLDELNELIGAAYLAKDMKTLGLLAKVHATLQRTNELSELKARIDLLTAITGDVAKAIKAALQPMVDSGKLDQADGVWYAWDFGDKLQTCRLMKTTAKVAGSPKSSGNGVGKKYSISTAEMLTKHGQEIYKEGLTFSQAQEKSTDKNWRYAIREALLKLEGIIQ